ncbi:nucleotide exchange factor GrpE [Saccharopolyspora taberi]|uniref:Nucleotide exchange factor GrpE n=1 Tax=Saccharopolyspora taberi TaxID=60895 RepID=A0ABN3VC95_9PSEU
MSSREAQRSSADPGPADGGALGEVLAGNRTATLDLVRALDAHREHTEHVLRELDRVERDLARLLSGITGALDAFDRLLAHDDADFESYRASVHRTRQLLIDVLCNNSELELIGWPGELADPETHHVAGVAEAAGLPRDAVVKVLKHGIRYRGELVYRASVIVASGEEKQQ